MSHYREIEEQSESQLYAHERYVCEPLSTTTTCKNLFAKEIYTNYFGIFIIQKNAGSKVYERAPYKMLTATNCSA